MGDAPVYRPCVGMALFNNEGRVFVGERIDTPGAWQMPQGGIDEGESVEAAAMRELAEEAGTDKAEIFHISAETIRYDLPDFLRQKLWNGVFAGQEQTWVAARFTGEDRDIDLNSFNPPEFQRWQWVPLEETVDLIVPFKRDVYARVISMFSDLPSLRGTK